MISIGTQTESPLQHRLVRLTIFFSLFLAALVTHSAETENPVSKQFNTKVYPPRIEGQHYAPVIDADYPAQVFWGDTHLHSSMSADANSAGNEKLSPADAYRFASGSRVIANNGMPVQLDRPLDFLVVSDHAEYLGLFPMLKNADPALASTQAGRQLLEKMSHGKEAATELMTEIAVAFIVGDGKFDTANFSFDTWKQTTAIADQYNKPGTFTALIGYEWTSFPQGDNLHRVVVYKDGAEKAAAMRPFSALDGLKPEELWQFMDDYEEKTGGDILAIPHNGNVSNGLMFSTTDSNGNALDSAYTKTRAHWEPIVEVTQIKGDGEAHPFLSPDDEFADFETWDSGNLNPFAMIPKTNDMLQHEYARSALKIGLQQGQKTGTNPYKFGMIGSTDAHTSLATADENNFWGKASPLEPGVDRSTALFFKSRGEDRSRDIYSWQQVASGYAAVWAKENTRAALFEAMERKEVYATTGPRITVRFFAGWDFEDSDHQNTNLAKLGYKKGVPMGGDLQGKPSESIKSPRFLVSAIKDPLGANLDRIQIIKGWLDSEGQVHEKVYNVAASAGRKINRKGRLKPITSTVNLEQASFDNSVGSAQLATVWEDPNFNPEQSAFYYARVLEIFTPRWTEIDKHFFGIENPENAVKEIQERAYTSPIWYTPPSK